MGINTTNSDADVEPDTGDAPDGAQDTPRFHTPVRITFYHTRKRLADLDNLSVKAAIDGLVQAKVLADDTPQQVAEIRHRQAKGAREETRIVIEPLTAAQRQE